MLEVDLEYSKELHDLHNDYSLASEKIVMKESILSDYCKKLKQISIVFQLTMKKNPLPSLCNKGKYVLH